MKSDFYRGRTLRLNHIIRKFGTIWMSPAYFHDNQFIKRIQF